MENLNQQWQCESWLIFLFLQNTYMLAVSTEKAKQQWQSIGYEQP